MAIFVNENTKVIVLGLTGGQGKYHGLRNRDYGTKIVGGDPRGGGRRHRVHRLHHRGHPGPGRGEGLQHADP